MVDNLYENRSSDLQITQNLQNAQTAIMDHCYETINRDSDYVNTYDVLDRNVDSPTQAMQKKRPTKRYIVFVSIVGLLLVCIITVVCIIYINMGSNNENIAAPSWCPVDKDYIYYSDVHMCLRFIHTELLHANATDMCSMDDGNLVKINSSVVQQNIELILETQHDSDVWIQGQLNRLNSSEVWKFDDQSNMTYFNWNRADGQPEGGKDEIFIALRKSQNYKWHDVNTRTRLRSLCQIT